MSHLLFDVACLEIQEDVCNEYDVNQELRPNPPVILQRHHPKLLWFCGRLVLDDMIINRQPQCFAQLVGIYKVNQPPISVAMGIHFQQSSTCWC